MSARLLSPRRLQALGMVAIGALAGFAIATSWGRFATAPSADAPPAADVREAGPDDLTPPGPATAE